VPHAVELLAFADALVAGDRDALRSAADAVRRELGSAAVVDAAAVASNFERMVRIADGTGIPLDAPVVALSADLRAELGLDAYGSAGNTPSPGPVMRLIGPVLGRFVRVAMRARALLPFGR